MSAVLNMLSAALYAAIFQNLIFSGGYGVSEAIRIAAKPKQLLPMSGFIIGFSVSASGVCVLLDKIPEVGNASTLVHALLFTAVLVLLYFAALLIAKLGFKAHKRTLRRLGMAAFNTLVLAVPFINYRAAFSVPSAIGSGIGAGFAFAAAVLLMNSGLRRLHENPHIPQCFQGTPALFIYVSVLSLAFTGFAGRGLTL